MADNTRLNPGSGGDNIATEDIGTYKIPVCKIRTGATDVDGGDVTTANPFPVAVLDQASGARVDSGSLSVNTEGRKGTYSASVVGMAVAATPTDIFTLTGSASKTIRITRLGFSGTAATAGIINVAVVKRSTADTSGTSTNPAAVPHDSNNAAATATVAAYTANPTLGSIVGSALRTAKLALPLATASGVDAVEYNFGDRNGQGIVLRGTGQVFALNGQGSTLPGATTINVDIEWTEE